MKKVLLTIIFVLGLPLTAKSEGIYVQGDIGYGVQSSNFTARDNGIVIGGAIGYQLPNSRFDLNFVRSPQSDNGGGRIGKVDSNILSVNGYIEPITYNNFTPFATAGLGYGFFSGKGSVLNHEVPIVNIGAGSSYIINGNWALVGEYRYFTSTNDVARNNDNNVDNFKLHTFTSSVKYNF